LARNLTTLTPRQISALEALANGESVAGAARASGASERTVRRWRASPAFARDLADRRREGLRQAGAQLVSAATEAVAVLRAVIADQESGAPTRVAAARVLLAEAFRVAEIEDVVGRIEEIEARLS